MPMNANQLNKSSLLIFILCLFLMENFKSTIFRQVKSASIELTNEKYQQAWSNFTNLATFEALTANNEEDYTLKAANNNNNLLPSVSSIMLSHNAKNDSGCPTTTSSHCLRCNKDGCIKCPQLLITDTRQCTDKCPSGYIDQWSSHTEFIGRICVRTDYSSAVMAAIAGLIGGFLVCLSIFAVAVIYVRYKRRRTFVKQKLINDNTIDRHSFLVQLNRLRPHAEYFLAMLNDTRRQIRKRYLAGDVAAANAYRPLIRDLAKILILLNRPFELIPTAPPDWPRLHTWARQVLQRQKLQGAQHEDFLQSHSDSLVMGNDFDRVNYANSQRKSIFRQSIAVPTLPSSTSTRTPAHNSKPFGSLVSLHGFEEPKPTDPFGSSFSSLHNNEESGNFLKHLNASSSWLEDEFYKLGFRPQDEITTEL